MTPGDDGEIVMPIGDGELAGRVAGVEASCDTGRDGRDTGPSPVVHPAKPRKYKPWVRMVSMTDPIPRDPGKINPWPKTVKRRAGGFRRAGGKR